jgi:Sec63 Brl domain.
MASLARAMFQVSLSKRNAAMAANCLQVAKMIEKGIWNVCNETVESPQVKIEAHLRPLSRTVFQMIIFLTPAFV